MSKSLVLAVSLSSLVACTTADPAPAPELEGGKADTPLGAVQQFIYTPLYRQQTEYTCGVAALQSVLHYYGVEDQPEATVAEALGSDPDGGTDHREMMAYARQHGLTATTRANMTVDDLAALIDRKRPVILAIQAWADDGTDYAESYENGHYVVATGIDRDNVYFMDPYTRGTYTFIPKAELETRWHDMDIEGPLEHWGLILEGKAPAFDFERPLAMP
jgi:predicted double-glycine peptidase